MIGLRAALVAVFLLVAAQPVAAQTWLRAESRNFVAYSDGGEGVLRNLVTKLERFDQILRLRFGIPADRPVLRKLPVYLVSSREGLTAVRPGLPREVGGFYIASEEDVFAIVLRNAGDELILHEYAHHFFYQHMNAPYPAWLSEGLAEYVMTTRIGDESFVLGDVDENRASWLVNGDWLDLEDLLTLRVGQIEVSQHRATYYPVAWLLTHWFFATPERTQQLNTYLRLVGSGVGPADAIAQATGLTPDALTLTLTGYARASLRSTTFPVEYAPVEITMTRLPASAADLLLVGQRIKIGVPDEDRAATVAEVRRLAARWPDDPLALLVLGHAELHMGDAVAGEATLSRLLEIQPDDVAGLQFLATGRLREADGAEDAQERSRLLAEARGFLARAYAANPDDYFTLLLIARSREGQPGYPSDNDLRAWQGAYDGAPQLAAIRLGYGRALIARDLREEALTVLTPLANSPHGGPAADAARALIEETEEAPAAPEAEEPAPPAEEVDQAG